MRGFGNLCRTIQARDKLSASLASVELRLEETEWYRWRQRRSLRLRAAELQQEIADRNSKINDEEVRALANDVGWDLWDKAAAEVIPKKNTHGPAARERFDDIVDKALELGRDYAVYVYKDSSTFPISTLPEVRSLVTRNFIERAARRTIDERAAIAASTELIHVYDHNHEGRKRLWVQHVASGLRAVFTLHGDGFGGVEAKSTKLGSIDPAKSGVMDMDEVSRVAGLRIGQQIYEEAHRLEPEVRWFGSSLSGYSGPLRRRLHNAAPYVWSYSSCQWCDVNGIYQWTKAEPSTFLGHPA